MKDLTKKEKGNLTVFFALRGLTHEIYRSTTY